MEKHLVWCASMIQGDNGICHLFFRYGPVRNGAALAATPEGPFIQMADNRYRLYLDRQTVGREPERGSPERCYCESYELELSDDEHILLNSIRTDLIL